MNELMVTFLEAGQQTAAQVAGWVARFVAQATQTVDLAIYDMHLSGEASQIVLGALQARQQAGVQVRICYDSGDTAPNDAQDLGGDPPSPQTKTYLANSGLPAKPIASEANLMHQKYVVLDAYTDHAQVWTGSTNWTDDSWTLQENNILTVASPALANFYIQDFQELWSTGDIQSTGAMDTGHVTLSYKGAPAPATVSFAPGRGQWIDTTVAACIHGAQREITLAFAVLTSGHILGALGDLIHQGAVPIDGVYDRTQMDGVFHQWRQNPHAGWKIPAFQALVDYGRLVGKNSTPWAPGSTHDFLHDKIIVVDDTVITGSYNFSRNAQANAENILLIESAALAADYRTYIRHLATRYGQGG